jgi:hypothetical protein
MMDDFQKDINNDERRFPNHQHQLPMSTYASGVESQHHDQMTGGGGGSPSISIRASEQMRNAVNLAGTAIPANSFDTPVHRNDMQQHQHPNQHEHMIMQHQRVLPTPTMSMDNSTLPLPFNPLHYHHNRSHNNFFEGSTGAPSSFPSALAHQHQHKHQQPGEGQSEYLEQKLQHEQQWSENLIELQQNQLLLQQRHANAHAAYRLPHNSLVNNTSGFSHHQSSIMHNEMKPSHRKWIN